MRNSLFIFFFFIFSLIGSLNAQERDLEVRPTGKELFEIKPREIITTNFYVSNNSSEVREFISEIALPEDWKLITEDFPFELTAEESDIRVVSFFIPQTTLAGKYEVTFSVKDREFPSISDYYTVYVVVLPVSLLKAELLDIPELVIAGDDYEASFVIVNEGNSLSKFNIKVESDRNLPFHVDVENSELAPGESKTVKVTVSTNERIREEFKHLLKVTSTDLNNEKISSQTSSSIEVIPRITGNEDSFHRIPVNLRLRVVGENNDDTTAGFQSEISGEGTLDELGEKHIDFLFRGPDTFDKSIFSDHDEAIVNFTTKNYEIHLGDRGYSLSKLTENYHFGRGIEGKLNVRNISAGAYQMKTRWISNEEKQIASYVDYLALDKYKIGLNYLKKKDDEDVEISSLESQFKISNKTDVELEYALSKKQNKKDEAYLLEVSGVEKWVNYRIKYLHADTNYSGYYRDTNLTTAGFTFPLKENIRIKANYNQVENNLNLDPLLNSAPLSKYYQLGIDYRFNNGTIVLLEWGERSRKDQLPSPKYDSHEESIKFRVGRTFKSIIVDNSVDLGKTKNKLKNQISSLERYTSSFYYRTSNNNYVKGYLFFDKNGGFTGEEKRNLTHGFSGSYQIKNKTLLYLDYQYNNYEPSKYVDRILFDMRLSYTFANNNIITARSRHTSYIKSHERNETSFMVEYSIPFGLPVSRKKDIGMITGTVYDEVNKEAIPDVILRLNGSTAVTDKNGKFTFAALKSGTYYISVDTARIGLDRITTLKTPIELKVEGGEETLIDIEITRTASVSGKITLYRFENGAGSQLLEENSENNSSSSYNIIGGSNKNGSLNNDEGEMLEAGGLENIVVEITNGSETKRRITDRNGNFIFEELRPGSWNLKVEDNNLPEYHYLEKDIFEFELEAGEKSEIPIKVLPRKRPIRIIEDGGFLGAR